VHHLAQCRYRYATTPLGGTASKAIGTCAVSNLDGYNNPAICNQPPTKPEKCTGQLAMRLVEYPQFGTQQYECKAKVPAPDDAAPPEAAAS
jgi:hypothetical protein